MKTDFYLLRVSEGSHLVELTPVQRKLQLALALAIFIRDPELTMRALSQGAQYWHLETSLFQDLAELIPELQLELLREKSNRKREDGKEARWFFAPMDPMSWIQLRACPQGEIVVSLDENLIFKAQIFRRSSTIQELNELEFKQMICKILNAALINQFKEVV